MILDYEEDHPISRNGIRCNNEDHCYSYFSSYSNNDNDDDDSNENHCCYYYFSSYNDKNNNDDDDYDSNYNSM